MIAQFDRFEIQMTKAQAASVSHSGECEGDVRQFAKHPKIAKQLNNLCPDKLRSELKECGAWDESELKDDEMNKIRILWIASGNISEEIAKQAIVAS